MKLSSTEIESLELNSKPLWAIRNILFTDVIHSVGFVPHWFLFDLFKIFTVNIISY